MSLGLRPSNNGDLPATYPSSATAIWEYGGNVDKLAYSINDISPAISEYIAYDNLTPANPFIAVTQDGSGKVVYDGGFPKLYNGAVPTGTTWNEMDGTYRYLLNCLEWIANDREVLKGNRKILVLGDNNNGETYCVTGTGPSDFYNSFMKLGQVGQWEMTFRTSNSYGVNLDATLSELTNYVAVIVMSSNSSGAVRITDTCVADLVSFRSQGGGLMLITDHGVVINDLEGAKVAHVSSFFNVVNKIAVNFGAWFSGDYNRTPVNLGWIRENYGDHLLYKNMLDSEAISAGGSESRVFVNDSLKLISPSEYPETTFTIPGVNTINFLVKSLTGDVKTFRFTYVIGAAIIINFRDINNNLLSGTVNIGTDNYVTLNATLNGDMTAGTLVGKIYRNNDIIGDLYWDNQVGSVVNWYGGDNVPIYVSNGDVIRGVLTLPFTFEEKITVNRIQPLVADVNSLSRFVNQVKVMAKPVKASKVLEEVIKVIDWNIPLDKTQYNSTNVANIKRFLIGDMYLEDTQAYIYDDPGKLQAALDSITPPSNREIYDDWTRFAADEYYPKGVPIPSGSEAGAWVWNDSLNSAVMPLNSAAFLGFVSDDLVETYDNDVVLRSDLSGDDDFNGVILAFYRDEVTGKNRTLNVIINRGANGSLPNIHITLDGSTFTPHTVLQSNNKDDEFSGWSGAFKRVRVMRRGDDFTILISKWNTRTFEPELTMHVDLDSDPRLEIFKGPRQYGYCNQSQPSSFFSEIKYYGGLLKNIIIDAVNNITYRYIVGEGWKTLDDVIAHSVYGSPRRVFSVPDNEPYILNRDGTITLPDRPLVDTGGTWKLLPPGAGVPAGRISHGMIGHRDKFYMFNGYVGGSNFSYLRDSYVYDPTTSKWTVIPTNQMSPFEVGNIFAEHGDFIYSYQTAGNQAAGSGRLKEFDTRTNTWRILTESFSVDSRTATIAHGGMFYHDRHLYIFGGVETKIDAVTGIKFNLDTETYTPIANFITPFRNKFSIVRLGDKAYLFGGEINGVLTNELWEYDIKENEWTQLNPSGVPPTPRTKSDMFVHRGSIYVYGGDATAAIPDKFFGYDIKNNRWVALKPKGTLPVANFGSKGAYVRGKYYLFSGMSGWPAGNALHEFTP